ncbi:MAG: helix-turn-helix domain-containing protein [Clostridium sp.]
MKQVIDKEYVKNVDSEAQKDIEEAENLAEIVGAMIRQRNSLGIFQRELAAMCNMPQSSVARIESMKTTPNLDTLLKLFEPLGLALTVSMKRV